MHIKVTDFGTAKLLDEEEVKEETADSSMTAGIELEKNGLSIMRSGSFVLMIPAC